MNVRGTSSLDTFHPTLDHSINAWIITRPRISLSLHAHHAALPCSLHGQIAVLPTKIFRENGGQNSRAYDGGLVRSIKANFLALARRFKSLEYYLLCVSFLDLFFCKCVIPTAASIPNNQEPWLFILSACMWNEELLIWKQFLSWFLLWFQFRFQFQTNCWGIGIDTALVFPPNPIFPSKTCLQIPPVRCTHPTQQPPNIRNSAHLNGNHLVPFPSPTAWPLQSSEQKVARSDRGIGIKIGGSLETSVSRLWFSKKSGKDRKVGGIQLKPQESCGGSQSSGLITFLDC